MAGGRFGLYFVSSLVLGVGVLVALVVVGRDAPAPAEANSAPTASTTSPASPTTSAATLRAVTVSPRGGLPNVAAKLSIGKAISVVYLGGGVTASGGGRGFCDQITSWIRSQHPGARVRSINAGIHRSNSEFAAARFDRDVLSAKPDLVFVDLAASSTREERRDDESMIRAIERIVRKAWTADPAIDFVFLHTLAEVDRETWKRGVLPAAAASQERVAEHYGIPTLAPALAASQAMSQDGVSWVDLFVDEMVPTPRGHALYASVVTGAMPELLATKPAEPRALADIKPLSKRFWLYPSPLRARPQGVTPPMELVDGTKALRTWDMPVVGVHWIGSAEYLDPDAEPAEDGKRPVLWRLRSQSARENGRRLNDVFSLDRTRWGPPMQWFDEYRCFHGPAGLPLIETQDKQRHHLEARGDDLPIVSFIAPRDGRYVFSVRAEESIWWGSDTAIAMNIVRFRKDDDRGESVGLHRSQEGLLRKPEVAGEVQMKAGDELAFCVDTNSFMAGGGASYVNTLVSIGFFGK